MNRRRMMMLLLTLLHFACGRKRIPRYVTFEGQQDPSLDDPESPQKPRSPSSVSPKSPTPPAQGNALAGLKIALDVGHGNSSGGYEEGAESAGIVEYKLNEAQGKRLSESLGRLGAKVSVFQYTQSDKGLSLTQRGARAEGHQILISLHHNSYDVASVHGGETLVESATGTAEDKKLAKFINDAIIGKTQQPNRGIKIQSLGVLRGAPSGVVKILTEPFFITSSGMTLAKAQDLSAKACDGIVAGLVAYWQAKQSLSLIDMPEPEVGVNDLPGLYDDHVGDD